MKYSRSARVLTVPRAPATVDVTYCVQTRQLILHDLLKTDQCTDLGRQNLLADRGTTARTKENILSLAAQRTHD